MKTPEGEQSAILKRLGLALLKDRKENPNTYEILCGLSHAFSRSEQYANEEALLRKITNPDGFPVKIYPEFE